MARSYGHHGDWRYDDGAPVRFREGPFYNDLQYRRDFRDQHVEFGHGGLMNIPGREQVLIRREDPWCPPWWLDRGYPVYVVEQCPEAEQVESTVELHAPQLCCDSCERRVVDALRDFPSVRNVVADQWEKKVVVVGMDIRPEHVLRRLQRVSHMDRSEFWHDRRH